MIEKYFENMGREGVDKVTGYKGIITSLSFDLFGCVQYSITPYAKEGEQELKYGHWFDITRIKVGRKKKVMDAPDYVAGYETKDVEYITAGKKGCADKAPLH